MSIWNPFARKPMPADGPEAEKADLSTVFNWTRNRGPLFHMMGFVFFSLIIHSAGFYLFQVVYPPPVRLEPEGESVTMMDPGDPAVRALLKRVEDRTVFLFPPSTRAGVRIGADDIDVRFTPSFQNTQLDPVPPAYDWDLPPVLKAPLEVGELPAAPTGIEISRSGDIANRAIAPWSIMRDYLERADWLPDLAISLEASPEGIVIVTRVEGELQPGEKEELKQVVESTLRFVPQDKTSRGEIRIHSLAEKNPAANEVLSQ